MLQEAEARLGVGEDAGRAATRAFDEAVREMAGDVVGAVVTELAVAPLPQDRPEGLRAYARGVMAALVRMDLTRRTAEARASLQRMEPDDPGYAEAFQDLMRLEQRRRTYAEIGR
jgi:DNA primase